MKLPPYSGNRLPFPLLDMETKKARRAIQFGLYELRCPPCFEIVDRLEHRLGALAIARESSPKGAAP